MEGAGTHVGFPAARTKQRTCGMHTTGVQGCRVQGGCRVRGAGVCTRAFGAHTWPCAPTMELGCAAAGGASAAVSAMSKPWMYTCCDKDGTHTHPRLSGDVGDPAVGQRKHRLGRPPAIRRAWERGTQWRKHASVGVARTAHSGKGGVHGTGELSMERSVQWQQLLEALKRFWKL
jgi:hypothetical protein